MERKENVGIRRVPIKAYTLKDLAGIYETSLYHMRKRLKKIKKAVGEREGYFYEIEQVRKIFKLEPLPSHIEII